MINVTVDPTAPDAVERVAFALCLRDFDGNMAAAKDAWGSWPEEVPDSYKAAYLADAKRIIAALLFR